MTGFEDIFGTEEDDGRPMNGRSKRARKSLGPLHDLLTQKFPHLIDPQSGVCNLHKIAKLRGMTFQGVYKWFRERDANRLPYAQAMWLIELSGKYQQSDDAPEDYAQLTLKEMQPYITTT